MLAASHTLARARFFLEAAEAAATRNEREALGHYLDSAIVFGRSVTFHLQKELAHHPGFDRWYELKQAEMAADPVMGVLKDMRNLILKQRAGRLNKTVHVGIVAELRLTATLDSVVIRARPWCRRSPKILLQDSRAWLRRRWRMAKTKLRPSRPPKARRDRVRVRETFYLEAAGLEDRSAFEVVREYLDKLEGVVIDAGRQFTISGE